MTADPADRTTHIRWTPSVGDDDGREALIVDGVVQSILLGPEDPPEGYWAAMVPDERPRRALILGVGGGTVAHLLHRRFGALEIVGVDCDARVLDLAREHFGLAELGMRLVEADGVEWVNETSEKFSLVCVDMFRGTHADRRVMGRPFLRGLERIVEPRGLVIFNLHRHRRAPESVNRIGRVFRIIRKVTVGKNVVVTARRSHVP